MYKLFTKLFKQSQVSITDKSHLVCSRRKVEDAPLNGDKNAVIHTGHRSCFTHSNNKGKVVTE
jgi:hypothetical protein